MKNRCWLLLALMLLTSCGVNVKREYSKILDRTNVELNELIKEFNNLDSYEISARLCAIHMNYVEEIYGLQEKIVDEEKKQMVLYEIVLSFPDINAYNELVDLLTKKNSEILSVIGDIKWINDDTNDYKSIFYLDSDRIQFLNFNRSFDYSIVDGNVVTSSYGPLFFNYKEETLEIRDAYGNNIDYRQCSNNDYIFGRWACSNCKYDGVELIANGDAKEIVDVVEYYATYTLADSNQVTTFTRFLPHYIPYGYRHQSSAGKVAFFCAENSYSFNYIYDPINDLMKLQDGPINESAKYVREKVSGPGSLTFLFTGRPISDISLFDLTKITDDGLKEDLTPVVQMSEDNKVEKEKRSKKKKVKGNEWDKVLYSYEKLVEDYIDCIRKPNLSNIRVAVKLGKLVKDTYDIAEKLENAKSEMTPEQRERMGEISLRFYDAMAEYSKKMGDADLDDEIENALYDALDEDE